MGAKKQIPVPVPVHEDVLHAADFAVMREALQHALASHNNKGRAQLCGCSLCLMIKGALKPGAARDYANRIRNECVQVVDWKVNELQAKRADPNTLATAREIADLLRVLTLPL